MAQKLPSRPKPDPAVGLAAQLITDRWTHWLMPNLHAHLLIDSLRRIFWAAFFFCFGQFRSSFYDRFNCLLIFRALAHTPSQSSASASELHVSPERLSVRSVGIQIDFFVGLIFSAWSLSSSVFHGLFHLPPHNELGIGSLQRNAQYLYESATVRFTNRAHIVAAISAWGFSIQ